ncbi:VOC family protein [Roseisalinus antarcticus]|uniref:27 kDa antigen Cfp30B n=1 Tax=Roseisalinus antarcticus TaxID=254357 RepID=A0A1Y5SAP4_9RHOB|nr:VOC family protein [Roseisalinus antarcticus]SLN36336.1 27 kDa antigen Cfp30B [Roseisalinus antarcticus]
MPDNSALVVWTEIPVTNLAAASEFYSDVFGWTMTVDDTGPNPMASFNSDSTAIGGHLYPGTPSRGGVGPTIHLAVPDTVEAAAGRCTAAGGQVMGPIIPIPPGRFQYATDPDGNSIGLFEPSRT